MNPLFPVVEIHQLSFDEILHPVSATWASGQMVGIVGPNGAGKSTLLRMVAGIWTPTTGSVNLNQVPLTHLSVKDRARNIAYLPQQISDECPYTVHDFVEMGRYAHRSAWGGLTKKGRSAVHQAIVQMGLHKYVDVPLSQLSGGERQRAAVARCLAQESPTLILDEPISNLDIYYQIDILERLKKLADSGYLVVLSIHHLEFAARYCTNVMLLHEGTVYAQGAVGDVLSETAVADVFSVQVKRFRDPYGNYLRFSYQLP